MRSIKGGSNRETKLALPFHIPHYCALRPLPTLTNTPVATRATNRLDRPYEMNGSVMPVAGRSASVTPM